MPHQRYSIVYKNAAARILRKLQRQDQRKLLVAIEKLAEDPRPSGVKKLQGGNGEYRLRVGDFRVIYEIDDGKLVVLVLTLRHRREIYRKL